MYQYEDGSEAKIGDTGIFAYAVDGRGYLYEGQVVAINRQGRLTIEGPVPTLIMANVVTFYEKRGNDETYVYGGQDVTEELALHVRKYSARDARRHEQLREKYQRWLVQNNGTFLDFVLASAV